MTVEITDTSKIFVTGTGAGQIDPNESIVVKEKNPPIDFATNFIHKSAKSVGVMGVVMAKSALAVMVVAGCCGISFMYLAKLIQFLEFVSYFILFNTDMGGKLNGFFYELYEVMQFDPIPNINEFLFSTRDHAEGYFWNGKVTQTGMLDWIYVNAAGDFVFYLFVLLASLVFFCIIMSLKYKAYRLKIAPHPGPPAFDMEFKRPPSLSGGGEKPKVPALTDYDKVKENIASHRNESTHRSNKITLMTLNSPRVEDFDKKINSDEEKQKAKESKSDKKEKEKSEMEKQHPTLYKWNRRFTTMRFNMTQAGLIDYTIFVSLNLSRVHLFFLPGVNTKANATEICFLILTCIVGVQVTLHILLHFVYLNKHKVRLSDD